MVFPMLVALAMPPEARDATVEAMLTRLSIRQKSELIAGFEEFNVRPVPEIGLPKLVMSDGPAGVRNYGPTTAYPAPVALAASFDLRLAEEFGRSIARDARARGVHFWLGPGVNLARIPQNGRNFEYAGEDPVLAGEVAGHLILGVQSGGVAATIKHFVANEHEQDRFRDSSNVDERTLRELYLRPFQIANAIGKPWAFMCSYNLLNGTYTSQHDWLNNKVLKGEWGFQGVLMSDWGATHDLVGAFKGGLDLEMPGPDHFRPELVEARVKDGTLSLATLDDKVRRILRVALALGWTQRAQKLTDIPIDDPFTQATALEIARKGTVLLKNNGLLPLNGRKVKRILVVGPNVEGQVSGGGGSSWTTPHRFVGLRDAVQLAAGFEVKVETAPYGDPEPSGFEEGAATTPDGRPGVLREVYDSMDLSGAPKASSVVSQIDDDWSDRQPEGLGKRERFSVAYRFRFNPTTTGRYAITGITDDGVRAEIDGRPVIDEWYDRAPASSIGFFEARVGVPVNVVIRYYQKEGRAVCRFGIRSEDAMMARAIPSNIGDYDAVIANVGFNAGMESEGQDRPFALPGFQNRFLRELVRKHPRTVVVLNSGGAVSTAGWLGSAAGLVHAWYPGAVGNQAVAEILFGIVNPSGRLPISWPAKLEGTYYATAYPPVDGKVEYREKLLMGYRWFDAKKEKPLYPFGFGLSYTKFELGGLRARQEGDELVVSLRIRNAGARSGIQTVQVYAGPTARTADRPVRSLVGYARVALEPGRATARTLRIPLDRLMIWDGGWKLPPGSTVVQVGENSGSLPLRAVVNLQRRP